MSEAIKIKEGGVDRSQNQIQKLKTNMQGGGVCYWVPETERKTDSKSINKNGTYTAENEGLYGYDEITVSVPDTGKITGVDPISGEDVSIGVDPETGMIVETTLPASIQIVIRPTKTTYIDGESIDLTGIEVYALDGHGEVWTSEDYPDGIIPVNELFPEPPFANAGESSEYSDGDGLNVLRVAYTSPTELAAYFVGDVIIGATRTGKPLTFGRGTQGTSFYVTVYDNVIYWYGIDLKGEMQALVNLYDVSTPGNPSLVIGTSARTEPQVWTSLDSIYTQYQQFFAQVPVSTKDPLLGDVGNLHPTDAQIAVNWTRPDGATLSDYYSVSILPVESGTAHGTENNGGGFEGGGSEHGF